MNIEARKHLRFRMKDGILAALTVAGTIMLTVGQIRDMSADGLTVIHTDEVPIAPGMADMLLLGYGGSQAPDLNIPARFIHQKNTENGFRYGFEFGDLSREQRTRVSAFIQSNVA